MSVHAESCLDVKSCGKVRGLLAVWMKIGFSCSVPVALMTRATVIRSLSFTLPAVLPCARVQLGCWHQYRPVSSMLKISSLRLYVNWILFICSRQG